MIFIRPKAYHIDHVQIMSICYTLWENFDTSLLIGMHGVVSLTSLRFLVIQVMNKQNLANNLAA